MAMTPAQLAILGTYITTQPDLASEPFTPPGTTEIQRRLNLPATPAGVRTVWRTSMALNVVALSFAPAELEGLSPLNRTRLQTLAMYMALGINPAIEAVRTFFLDVFAGPGGADTRANINRDWTRVCTRVERVYATGTGSQASPATLGYEGPVTYEDVDTARRLP